MKTREQILAENPLAEFMEARGITLRGQGAKKTTNRCAEVEHKPMHQCVSVDGDVWFCNDCGVGGSVIDFLSRADGIEAGEAMKRLSGEDEFSHALREKFQRPAPPAPKTTTPAGKIVKTYDYTDAAGKLLFQVCRMEPKTFRQRQPQGDGWTWSMDGARRVLYRLPQVKAADYVWIVEGEKDADTLAAVGFVATCNVGGAGKWDDSYSQTLKGKDVLLCGDTDEPGRKHVAKLQAALAGLAKTVTTIELPPEFKDVSDFFGSFEKPAEAASALLSIAEKAEVLIGGVRVPVFSLKEIEAEYREFAKKIESVSLSLTKMLPHLGSLIRPLVPGELVTFIAATGVGKTMLLQNLARSTSLVTLLFEMELPRTLTFERFVGIEMYMPGAQVASRYRTGDEPKWEGRALDNIHICSESKVTVAQVEGIIQKAGLKIGHRPQLVLLDYVQLIQGTGASRYERLSSIAEDLKILAKSTNTIVVIASQMGRGEGDDEPTLYAAKDSGSIENSSGLVIGAWRDPARKSTMHLKILKNTKGEAGTQTQCCIGEDLRLTEQRPTEEPQPK